MRIIPAIDLRDGMCVRLYKGDFDQTTEYSDDPVGTACRFANLRVDELHIVDLDGARYGQQLNRDIVRKIAAETDIAVQLGGGIRSTSAVEAWLADGVARCVVGSMAISDPVLVSRWLAEFGNDRIVLALDVSIAEDGRPTITTHGWTRTSETTLWDCIDRFAADGLVHVLCTDVSRDGAMLGPNTDLYAEIVDRYPELQLQASGGVRNIADLRTLRSSGVPAAITGRALLDGQISSEEILSFPQSA